MTEPSLRFEVVGADAAADGSPVLVLLHGRGADRHDLLGLHRGLPSGTVVVTPEAPHPGAPWGYGPGWAWYRYVAEDRVVPETLEHSLHRLEGFLGSLPEHLGFEPGATVLGGFSQGGTTSLAYGLTRPGTLSGIVVLSGFLADAPDTVPVRGAALDGVPVFWGHGTRDRAIPHLLGRRGRERLEAEGVRLTSRDYDMGHQIALDELRDLGAWLEAEVGLGGLSNGP